MTTTGSGLGDRGGPALSGVTAPARDEGACPIVGVGASAGGLEAIQELLRALPEAPGLAFVVIQHLDPTHPSRLGEALSRVSPLPVEGATDGAKVLPDRVYVIPHDADVDLREGRIVLVPRPPPDAGVLHLPIDRFFEALARECGPRAMGVVLSGTGSDGVAGLGAIKDEGGVTFAQAPASARFSGMPEAAVKAGVADFVLPLEALAAELVRLGRHPFVRGRVPDETATAAEDAELRSLIALVRGRLRTDLGEYKLASIRRRVARRMALRRCSTMTEYLRVVREEPAEVVGLFEDILVHVTSFFRNREAFEALEARVFPELLRLKATGGAIRIWSAGCSTGEEAYSLVIALLDFLAAANAADLPVQVFCTDLSERAIEKARAGWYPDGALAELGAARLARYFTKVEGGGYRINKAVRERCAFVKHDLASDPPFSKIDLVACRNVLIYFGHELQDRVLATFHFALNQPGYLLLGQAENVGEGSHLFSALDKEQKLFTRNDAKTPIIVTPRRAPMPPGPIAEPGRHLVTAAEVVRRTGALLLDAYAPPGVVVNERLEIVQFLGRTGPFLEPAPGAPQHDLLKMARPSLLPDLRIALAQARKDGVPVRRRVVLAGGAGPRTCDVVVMPVALPPEAREAHFAVLFEEPASPDEPLQERAVGGTPERSSDVAHAHAATLELELAATRDSLQAVIEEHRRANEELVSANEELVAGNEELQSFNEELETAKEELQSTNEELSSLNDELQSRNNELNAANSDLVNVLASVEVAIVIVDAARRIRRFTPRARPLLNLLPSDVGRPFDDIRPALDIDALDEKITEVIETVTAREEEARGRDGRWYRLQIRPYTTADKRIDGAVLSIVDIDVLKRALGAAEWARDYARATVEAVETPLAVLDGRLVVLSANMAFHDAYALPAGASTGRPLQELSGGVWNTPALLNALGAVVARSERFSRLEVEREFPGLGRRCVLLSGRDVVTPGGERLVLLSAEDVTDRQRAEAERTRLLEETRAARAGAEEANRAKDLFLAMLSHELRTPLSGMLLQAHLLRRGKLTEQRVAQSADAIERSVRAQVRLVDDLLDLSRIATGKLVLELKPTSLAAVAQGAQEAIASIADRRKVVIASVVVDPAPFVEADPERLQQVVQNLLTNAVKFAPEGGRVALSVDTFEGEARLRVSDEGRGIEPAFLARLFDPFSQEDDGQTRAHGGLGLGLAIVRRLVEAHGGSVRAESAGKGRGATFTVLLPLLAGGGVRAPGVEPVPVQVLSREHVEDALKGARVLVVDDDEASREAITEMLVLCGADVRAAASADEAWSLFESFRPELLVSDIAMPSEDGCSLLCRIRALGQERGGDLPAVALTALASEQDRRRVAAAGYSMHLAKPVDGDRLLAGLVQLRR